MQWTVSGINEGNNLLTLDNIFRESDCFIHPAEKVYCHWGDETNKDARHFRVSSAF